MVGYVLSLINIILNVRAHTHTHMRTCVFNDYACIEKSGDCFNSLLEIGQVLLILLTIATDIFGRVLLCIPFISFILKNTLYCLVIR